MANQWEWTSDTDPPVTVFERVAKGNVLYLRWYDREAKAGKRKGNYRYQSLGKPLRTASGHIRTETETWAKAEAEKQSARLAAGIAPSRPVAPGAPLTIAQGASAVTDPRTGKHPLEPGQKGSNHVREVVRALAYARAFWGADRTWDSLKRDDLRALWLQRLRDLKADGEVGYRGAETFVSRILAVAAWLRESERIGSAALLPPRGWRAALLADWRHVTEADYDPEPHRPRYTVDEARRFFAKVREGEPRLALAIALGAEYRLGQVIRARRKHLDLVAGTFKVSTKGKKGGETVHLTPAQRLAVEHALQVGYLHEIEAAGGDFPLFPSGRLEGWHGEGGEVVNGHRKGHRMVAGALHATEAHRDCDPVSPSALRDWFKVVEALAEIPPVKGRGWYAIRRASVDFNKRGKASPDAVMAGGGWSDPRMPDTIYADPEKDYARDEARDHRAKFRGEGSEGSAA